MKLSIILFAVFILFASLLPKKKCDCDDAYIEIKDFRKCKLVNVNYCNYKFWRTLKQELRLNNSIGSKRVKGFTTDSMIVTIIK